MSIHKIELSHLCEVTEWCRNNPEDAAIELIVRRENEESSHMDNAKIMQEMMDAIRDEAEVRVHQHKDSVRQSMMHDEAVNRHINPMYMMRAVDFEFDASWEARVQTEASCIIRAMVRSTRDGL